VFRCEYLVASDFFKFSASDVLNVKGEIKQGYSTIVLLIALSRKYFK
jgi:hypothetical protein